MLCIRILVLIIFSSDLAYSRPFWTQKTTYKEGGKIYFVGVASNARTIEDGRSLALENAKQELKNFLQVKSIHKIKFHSQHIWENVQLNGRFTVYRLMWIDENVTNKILEEGKLDNTISSIGMSLGFIGLLCSSIYWVKSTKSLENYNKSDNESDAVSFRQKTQSERNIALGSLGIAITGFGVSLSFMPKETTMNISSKLNRNVENSIVYIGKKWSF